VRGNGSRRTATIAKRIAEAITNLIAAKVKGGRSLSPSLMNSQVEPQMRHKRSQTRRDFIIDAAGAGTYCDLQEMSFGDEIKPACKESVGINSSLCAISVNSVVNLPRETLTTETQRTLRMHREDQF